MGRYSSEGEGNFKQAEAGTHIARCIRITDLGTQHGEYQGEPTVRSQVLLTWELPEQPMEDGKPFIVSAFLTNSLGEKAKMRAWLESWRGKQFTPEELKRFDLEKVLGVPCLLSVIHNARGKAVVEGVMAAPKSMKCPPQVNPSATFWLDEFDQAKFDALPKGIKAIVEQSDEYKAMESGEPDQSDSIHDLKSDIPF